MGAVLVTAAFAQEYMATWVGPSAEEIRAIEAWRWYYVSTELHDRLVCTGPTGQDGIMPANNAERAEIARHAQLRITDVRRMLADIDPEIVKRAKFEAQAYGFKRQDEVMRRAGMTPRYLGG